MNILLIIKPAQLCILFTAVTAKPESEVIYMKKKKHEEAVEAYRSTGDDTDVLGSYTGIYRSPDGLAVGIYPPCGETLSGKPLEEPVQDADDL